jgi:hypothetical protein
MRLSKKRWYVEPMSENECRGKPYVCLEQQSENEPNFQKRWFVL